MLQCGRCVCRWRHCCSLSVCFFVPNLSFLLLLPGAALSPSALRTGMWRLHYVSYPASDKKAALYRRSVLSFLICFSFCEQLKGFVFLLTYPQLHSPAGWTTRRNQTLKRRIAARSMNSLWRISITTTLRESRWSNQKVRNISSCNLKPITTRGYIILFV